MATVNSDAQATGRTLNIGNNDSWCDPDDPAIQAVYDFMLAQGIDLHLEASTVDTPARVAKAFREMTTGYNDDPKAILSKQFPCKHDQIVLVGPIDFVSLCEHHLMPFEGEATIAYIPHEGRVVGLSKLARLVECFARRLQIQERLTGQIADAIERYLSPDCAVIVKAHHGCMSCRGVKQARTNAITSVVAGKMKDANAKAELLRFMRL